MADLETSVRKALGKALEATEVEARKRAERQEDLLTQLLAVRNEPRWAQSEEWSVSTGDVDLMSSLPEKPPQKHVRVPGCKGRESRNNLARLKGTESATTLIPAPEEHDISGTWQVGSDVVGIDEVGECTQHHKLPAKQFSNTSWLRSKSIKNQSRLERCIGSSFFGGLCTLVIILNAVYMGVISDLLVKDAFRDFGSGGSDDQLAMMMMVFETLFLGWYVLELLLKLAAFRWYFFNGEDSKWNVFDTTLVVVGLVGMLDIGFSDLAWLRIVRALVKLVKALRVFRLVRFFEELRVIMLAIAHSLQTFFWAMVMLCLILYMCAIVFVQGVADYIGNSSEYIVPDEIEQDCFENWGSMHKAMLTEYKAIAGGGPWGHVTDGLYHAGSFYYYFFLVYIAVVVLAVFKLLTGIFVQKARAAADLDRERTIEHNMIEIFRDIDSDNSGCISRAEFKAAVESEVAKDYWQMLRIKPSDARKLFALMDTSFDDQVDIQEFISGCQKFGGWARNIDMAVAISRIHEVSMHLSEFMIYVEECFDCHFGHRGLQPPPSESLHERIKRQRKVRPSRVLFEFEAQVAAFNREPSVREPANLKDNTAK